MIDEDQVVRYAAVGGRSVAWSSYGSGPVVVIGGWWSSHLALDWEDPEFRRFVGLLARRHRVVRYDRPGTGLSDRGEPPHDRDEEVAVLAGLVDALDDPAVGDARDEAAVQDGESAGLDVRGRVYVPAGWGGQCRFGFGCGWG